MARMVRPLMVCETAAFFGAASVHFGVVMHGYEHRQASIAESVIGSVLLIGLAMTWMRGQASRRAALSAQAFALCGTLVGIFTIAIGVGPRSTADIAYHVAMIVLSAYGLVATARM